MNSSNGSRFVGGSIAEGFHFAVIVVSAASAVIGITPGAWVYMLGWVGPSLLGTAAILWCLYLARGTSLYADAGRELLGGK